MEGNVLEYKVVRITRRRRQHDDDRHQPVLKETGQRGVEGAVARPEAREGQDALTAQLLHQAALGEDDAEHVSVGRQSNEHAQRALGCAAKDVAEQRGGDEAAGGDDLVLGHRGEVGNVDKHVEHRDDANGQRRGDAQGADGVACFAQRIVRIRISNVAPDDVVQGRDDAVGAARGALKGVGEVVRLLVLGELEVAGKRNPAANDDDEDDDDLDGTEQVLQSDAPLECQAVDQKGRRDAGEADAALVPPVDLNVGSVEDVLAGESQWGGGTQRQPERLTRTRRNSRSPIPAGRRSLCRGP